MYRKSVLDNGIRIITESLPHVYSVSLGIWVESGSRAEKKSNSGITHFIEHMLFKGTEKRSALDIARSIESVGGVINAFTTREYTFFYSKVLKDKVGLATDILSDIFLFPLFDETELAKEKGVVGQEIVMLEDNPEDHIHDYSYMSVWPDNPLGFPVQGTRDTLGQMTRDSLIDYFEGKFKKQGIIIIAVGNVDHDEICRAFSSDFSIPGLVKSRAGEEKPEISRGVFVQNRDIEHVHLCITLPGPGKTDSDRYPAFVLNSILGGGMSSRLFQEVREKRGLVYSVYSSISSFRDTGLLKVNAGTSPGKVMELIKVIGDVFSDIAVKGISEEELESGKEQIKGNLLINFESTDYRLTRLASNEMYFEKYVAPEEVAERVEDVTLEEVSAFAGKSLENDKRVLAAIGNVSVDQLEGIGTI